MAANSNQLENRLWGAANELRANSKLKASEYSIPVLGLIFLRYAGVKFAAAEKVVGEKGGGWCICRPRFADICRGPAPIACRLVIHGKVARVSCYEVSHLDS